MTNKILFYGYGNPGCQDDALGINFVEQLQIWTTAMDYKNIFFEVNYQLNIEDAETISGYDIVYFVDASLEHMDGFKLSRVEHQEARVEFTMHAISPGVVLSLCQQIYADVPEVYLLHIKGFKWDLESAGVLSPEAENNLFLALNFMRDKLGFSG